MKKIVANGFYLIPEIRTVDFSTFNDFDIKKLYTIVDVKRNQVIYSLGTKGLGYTSYDSNLKRLVLLYNTANISASDPLTVLYEVDGKFDIENAIPAVMAPGEVLTISGYDEIQDAVKVKHSGNVRIDGYDITDGTLKVKPIAPVPIAGYNATTDSVKAEIIGNVNLVGFDQTVSALRVKQVEAMTLKGYDAVNDVIKIKPINNIRIDGYDTTSDAVKIKTVEKLGVKTNEVEMFRDEFIGTSISTTDWTINKDPNDFVFVGGNVDGSSYIGVITSYRATNTLTEITSRPFSLPARIINGVSTSNRINGTWFGADFLESDETGVVQKSTAIADIGITAISIASNTWTVTCAEDIIGKLKTNNIIAIYGSKINIANVGPVTITLASRTSFTFVWNATNATYTSANLGTNIKLQVVDPLDYAIAGVGVQYEANSANYFRLTSRNRDAIFTNLYNAGGNLVNMSSVSATTAFLNKPYTYCFKPSKITELEVTNRNVKWNFFSDESQTVNLGGYKKHLPVPNFKAKHVLRFAVKNLKAPLLVYKADISTIAKTAASTTVTVTTASPHDLEVGSQVLIAGVSNATEFPYSSTPVTVASVTSTTVFTYTLGTASTTTVTALLGGVFQYNGTTTGVLGVANTVPIMNNVFTNFQVTNNLLTLTATATVALQIGFHYQIFGIGNIEITNTIWRCAVASGTTAVLEPINRTTPVTNTALVNQNFAVLLAQETRLHFAQITSYERNLVEVNGTWGNSRDADEAMGVNVVNAPNIGTVTTVSTITNITNPVLPNTLTHHGTYTTAIPANSNVIALTTDFGTTITRSTLLAQIFSNAALSITLEFSHDNIVWSGANGTVAATAMTFPTWTFTGVTGTAPTRVLTVPNGHTALVGMTITIATVNYVVTAVTATSITFSAATFTPTTGTITVPTNGVFRAELLNISLWGRYARLRITNPSAAATTFTYATLVSIAGK
jgi:hypothetical protein